MSDKKTIEKTTEIKEALYKINHKKYQRGEHLHNASTYRIHVDVHVFFEMIGITVLNEGISIGTQIKTCTHDVTMWFQSKTCIHPFGSVYLHHELVA